MTCPCYRCTKELTEREPPKPEETFAGHDMRLGRMFLCQTCGNKRCPHEGWRDISSAPKDGTELLLYGRCERDGRFFSPDANVGWWDEEVLGGWQARDLPIEPSHWMPLPPPPGSRSPVLGGGGEGKGSSSATEQGARASTLPPGPDQHSAGKDD